MTRKHFVNMIGDYASIQEILDDPSIHYWVKDQWIEAMNRDILDALRDAELLVKMLEVKFNQSVGR